MNETERKDKFTSKKTIHSIESIDDGNVRGTDPKDKKMSLPVQIQEMKVSHDREMSSLKAELQEIKNAILGQSGSQCQVSPKGENVGNSHINKNPNRRMKRCQSCESKNWWRCFHCFHCGMADHRINDCPSRDQNQKN